MPGNGAVGCCRIVFTGWRGEGAVFGLSAVSTRTGVYGVGGLFFADGRELEGRTTTYDPFSFSGRAANWGGVDRFIGRSTSAVCSYGMQVYMVAALVSQCCNEARTGRAIGRTSSPMVGVLSAIHERSLLLAAHVAFVMYTFAGIG